MRPEHTLQARRTYVRTLWLSRGARSGLRIGISVQSLHTQIGVIVPYRIPYVLQVSGSLKQLLRYDANSDGRLSLPEMRATLEELDRMEGCRRGKTLYVRHMLRFLIRVHEIYRRNPHVACKQMANSLNMVRGRLGACAG